MRLIDEIHLEYPYCGNQGYQERAVEQRAITWAGASATLMRKMGIEALYRKPRLSKPIPGMRPSLSSQGLDDYGRQRTSGPRISPTFPWRKDSATLWRSWTGRAGRFSPCGSPTRWIPRSASRPSKRQSRRMERRTYSIPIRAASSPRTISRRSLRTTLKISMDGQGRWMDNVFIERLWKSVKYEDIYLKGYGSIGEVKKGLTTWFNRYNSWRRHQGLDNRTPDEVYWSTLSGAKDAV